VARRTDTNQQEIMDALRKAGANVQSLHMIGKGCPDLLVAFRGKNYLLEVKIPGSKLTPDEAKWHLAWRGPIAIVYSREQALEVIGATT
jgi:hypothetical protein